MNSMSLSPFATQNWPTEIRYKSDKNALEIDFDDGISFSYTSELLRVESPSAEVRGHDGIKKIIYGCRQVRITAIDHVGNYAVRLIFDDGHNTGIYSWSYLRYLGDNRQIVWENYLTALKEKGLSRDK